MPPGKGAILPSVIATIDIIWQYFAGSAWSGLGPVYLSRKAREDRPMEMQVNAFANEKAGMPAGGQPSIRFWTTTCEARATRCVDSHNGSADWEVLSI